MDWYLKEYDNFNVRTISYDAGHKNEKQNKQALCRIQELMKLNAPVNSDEYNELEVLSILVENYEAKAFPIDLPDPVAAIEFRMEQLKYDVADWQKFLAQKAGLRKS